MPVQEIPRQEWHTFCETFTRQHRGLLVTVEVVRPGEGLRVEGHELPLQEVAFEHGSSGKSAVRIRAGRRPGEQAIEFRVQPTRMWFEMSEAGEHVGLTLQGADGAQTRLRFRVPFLPEALDGLIMFGE